jgi:hypothetical protein
MKPRKGIEDWFEEGAVDRARAMMGHAIDVDLIARDCVDFCQRKHVGNPTGLLVTRCRAAYQRATRNAPLSAAGKLEEADRVAAFMVQTLQVVAEQGLAPAQIAGLLEDARQQGLPVNERTIQRLLEMGDSWPGHQQTRAS